MLSADEIREYLPSYLSQDSFQRLVDELKQFQSDRSQPFYLMALADKPILYQGDGITNGQTVRLPDTHVRDVPSFVISNTCDMALENKRPVGTSMVYAPIVALHKVIDLLNREFPDEAAKISDFEQNVRAQRITHIFFLPKGGKLEHDSVAILDQLNSIGIDEYDHTQLNQTRLFTLTDFGAWLLALKLSIHFCRIRDRVDRVAGLVEVPE